MMSDNLSRSQVTFISDHHPDRRPERISLLVEQRNLAEVSELLQSLQVGVVVESENLQV